MKSKAAGFLLVAIIVVGALLLFSLFSNNLGDGAIAGEAVRLGSGCVLETDNGLDLTNFGLVETYTAVYEDYCVDWTNLVEYYCDARGNVIEIEYECSLDENVCSSGACIPEEEVDTSIYIVEFVDEGFSVEELTISIGDTVEFVNSRKDMQAMLIGAQGHTEIKSEKLNLGESYTHQFIEVDRYVFC